jgi:uncharacterized protein (TIGR03437 family)
MIDVTSTGGPFAFSASGATQSGGQWLLVSPASGVSPQQVQVSVNPLGLALGTYQGTVTITPQPAGVPVVVPVALRVGESGPQINAVTNGASFLPGAVSPGEIVTIFGTNLGPQTLTTLSLTSAGTIDTTLAGTRVWFDEQLAPVIHTSSTQVTVVAPYSLAGKSTIRVQVDYNGTPSAVRQVPVAETAPGLFTIGGGAQGAILNQDSTVNGAQNGAAPGSIVSLFGTGEGLLAPAATEGAVASVASLGKPLGDVRVTIGGHEADVTYAGSAPGMPVGLIQVNARIPADVAAGPAPVVITIGSASSQPDVTVSVQR